MMNVLGWIRALLSMTVLVVAALAVLVGLMWLAELIYLAGLMP